MVSHLREEPGRVSVQVHVGYGDLPAVTVSRFWTDHVESRVGVVTPHFGRQMHLLSLSLRVSLRLLIWPGAAAASCPSSASSVREFYFRLPHV